MLDHIRRYWHKFSVGQWVILAIFAYFFVVLEPMMLARVVVLIVSVVFHEWAHGQMAHYLGDTTPKTYGRLTLNPLPHLDPIGSVLLPLMMILSGSPFLFGWAKPVPVNRFQLKDPINDMVKIAIAGPMINMLLAITFSVILRGLASVGGGIIGPNGLGILEYGIIINVVLAVFNMIPIPPMDGSRVLYRWLPVGGRQWLDKIEPYGLWIIIFLAFFNMFDGVIRGVGVPIIRALL